MSILDEGEGETDKGIPGACSAVRNAQLHIEVTVGHIYCRDRKLRCCVADLLGTTNGHKPKTNLCYLLPHA